MLEPELRQALLGNAVRRETVERKDRKSAFEQSVATLKISNAFSFNATPSKTSPPYPEQGFATASGGKVYM